MKPKVSIIIPTFNRENTIRRAVESVRNQTYYDWELIIVDDGSTDSTLSVVRDIVDPRIRVVQQKNQGAASARNHGISLSEGEWVAFLDSDDEWLEQKLASQMKFIEQRPGVSFVCCDELKIGPNDDTRLPQNNSFLVSKDPYVDLLLKNFISTNTVIIKRSILNELGGFSERLKNTEDYDLWLRVSKSYGLEHQNEVLSICHFDPEHSLSTKYKADNYAGMARIIENALIREPERIKLFKACLKKRLAGYLYDLGCAYAKASDYAKAAQVFQKSLSYKLFNHRGILLWIQCVLKIMRKSHSEEPHDKTVSPLVSVVIPTYNRADYITETLQSVLTQTYEQIEIVVVDDGSTDNTAAILKNFTREYPSKIKVVAGKHQGVASARNLGVQNASGGWIAFCDSDDLWEPHKILKQIKCLRDNTHLNLISTNAQSFSESGVSSGTYFDERPPQSGYVFNALFEKNFIITSSVMIKKSTYEACSGFRNEYSPSEDYEFWLRVSRVSQFGYVKEPLVRIRRHDTNISGDDEHSLSQRRFVLNDIAQDYRFDLSRKSENRAYAHLDRLIGYTHFLKGELQEAKAFYLKSLQKFVWQVDIWRHLVLLFIFPQSVRSRVNQQAPSNKEESRQEVASQ